MAGRPADQKRVLIVVSSYKPAISASMHRARMLGWYLRRCGWDFEILCPSVSLQPRAWIDPDADRFFAPDVTATEAPAMRWSAALKRMGIRGLSWQGLLPIFGTGNKLLKRGKFDLVFFSTTAFTFLCLGRLWQRRFGVPYAVDLQDPWFRDVPAKVATTKHARKATIGNILSRFMERYAIRKASGIISVSPHYLLTMRSRYPKAKAIQKGRIATIPFGALETDFSDSFGGKDESGRLTIAYVGAGGLLMAKSFRHFARSLARLRPAHSELIERFRVHLVGTDGGWTEGAPKILKNIADAEGIGDLVTESPATVSYSKATAIASAAHGLLVLGVDENAYMASKLFSYASLKKPLLACLCERSQMNSYFAEYPDLGIAIHFDGRAGGDTNEDAKVLEFLEQIRRGDRPQRTELMSKHSAAAMTFRIADMFDQCLSP